MLCTLVNVHCAVLGFFIYCGVFIVMDSFMYCFCVYCSALCYVLWCVYCNGLFYVLLCVYCSALCYVLLCVYCTVFCYVPWWIYFNIFLHVLRSVVILLCWVAFFDGLVFSTSQCHKLQQFDYSHSITLYHYCSSYITVIGLHCTISVAVT